MLHTEVRFDSRRAQSRAATAGRDAWVMHGRNDARDAGRNESVDARRCFSVMIARLERDVHRGAAGLIARRGQRHHFSVRFAESRMESFADHGTVANDDGADHRVRRRLSPPAAGEDE